MSGNDRFVLKKRGGVGVEDFSESSKSPCDPDFLNAYMDLAPHALERYHLDRDRAAAS